LGKPIPSPALLGPITPSWVERVKRWASEEGIALIRFQHGERKDEVAQRRRPQRGVRDQVVFIGIAQEKAQTFSGRKEGSTFRYHRDKTVSVHHHYFYLDDEDFGPIFLKVCSYAPWSLKLCLNGHEWAQRPMEKQGVAFETLDKGFRSCADPQKLQQTGERLGPEDSERLLRTWLERLPLPLSAKDREGGYDWQLSIGQMEVSLTQIFDRPQRGREFFEEVMRDNLDRGRPDRLPLISDRRVTKATPGPFRTRVMQHGVHPSLHIQYKNFDLKPYFKEGRGLRTQGTFRNPKDFEVNQGLANLPYLQHLGRHINRRLLEVERVSHTCGLSGDSIPRVVQPTVTEEGQRAPGLKFGDPRVMALWVALSLFTHLIQGFRNRDLRRHVGDLLGADPGSYSAAKMTYDLRRLRLKGLIYRPPRAHRYFLTPHGWKVARLMTRLEARVFRPAMAAFQDRPAALPPKLSAALQRVDTQLDTLIHDAVPLRKAG